MNRSILIVEDERPFLLALKKKLEMEGFQVIPAYNGQQGLDFARTKKPDLVILDLKLPILDGYQVLEKMRNSDWGENIPVIIATNVATEPPVRIQDEVVYLRKVDYNLKQIASVVSSAFKIIISLKENYGFVSPRKFTDILRAQLRI